MLNIAAIEHNNWFFLKNSKFHQITIMLLSSAFIALSAQVTLPLFPIPITLQNFAVLLIAAIFGPKVGVKVVLLYLLEGICGLPVFINFSHGLGPTGGYLIGYVGAVYVTGYLLQHHAWTQSRLLIFLAALFGDIVLFVFGYAVLAFFIGYRKAYLFGVAPFYLVELAKLLLFTLIVTPFLRITKTT